MPPRILKAKASDQIDENEMNYLNKNILLFQFRFSIYNDCSKILLCIYNYRHKINITQNSFF